MSYDVNARQCSSGKCKEGISPYNKSIRADLSEILWPSYVSLVTFCPVLLLATTRGPYRDKTPQPPLLPRGLSNGLIYPLSVVSKTIITVSVISQTDRVFLYFLVFLTPWW